MSKLNTFRLKLIDNLDSSNEDLIRVQPAQLSIKFKTPIDFEGKMRETQGAIGSLFISKEYDSPLTMISELGGIPMYTIVLKSTESGSDVFATCFITNSSVGGIAEFEDKGVKSIDVKLNSLSDESIRLEI